MYYISWLLPVPAWGVRKSTGFAMATTGAMFARRLIVPHARGARLASSSRHPRTSLSSRGLRFRDYEFDREWFLTAEQCQSQRPAGSVLTAMPYTYVKGREDPLDACNPSFTAESARKYSSFDSHEDWWEYIDKCQRLGTSQLFNEVLERSSPRCLYFDLDGSPCHQSTHTFIMELLQKFVRSFFLGDNLGWQDFDPQPVVLQSYQDEKYSCHVIFPQIQFDDHAHQSLYIPWMMRSLGKMVVEVEGGQERLLKRLVDCAVYRSFQLFRGPFACKLKNQEIVRSSGFEPEEFFRYDQLTCFAGYVQPDYALQIPSMEMILEEHQELLQGGDEDSHSSSWKKEDPALFSEHFQHRFSHGSLDLAGLTKLERYQALLQLLSPERADDWSSWFYVSGVTCNMLRDYNYCQEAQEQIWHLHCSWSGQSFKFDEEENWERILAADTAARLPSLRGLLNLVKHDNPQLQVRDNLWPFHMPKRISESGQVV